MTLYSATQGASSAACGILAACSGLSLAISPASSEMRATPEAPADLAVSLSGTATRAAVMFQSKAGEPGVATWDAGTWKVRLRSISGFTFILEGVYICRMSAACALVGTVASATGLGVTMLGTDAVYQVDVVQGAPNVGVASDTVYVVLAMRKVGAGPQAHTFRFDQLVETPIVLPDPAPPTVLAHEPGVRAAGLQASASWAAPAAFARGLGAPQKAAQAAACTNLAKALGFTPQASKP